MNAPAFEYPDAEVVIGLVCAVGTDYGKISGYLETALKRFGYKPNILRISSFIPRAARQLALSLPLSGRPESLRLKDYMDAGNEIRKRTNRCDVFALLAAAQLAFSRPKGGSLEPFPRTAHVILSLKRPEEVETLRAIYGPGFYLVGVSSTEQERLDNLMNHQNVSKDEALLLIQRDLEDEDRAFGQRTRDTFHRSDVFVALRKDRYRLELRRFLEIVFGYPYTTPTVDEFGMYHACAASLRSAQLGRQVGVIAPNRDLIGVGCNEVPAAGGGSYWEGIVPDARDHVRKVDSNDMRKSEIVRDILESLEKGQFLRESGWDRPRAEAILKRSLVGDITEFGRAVHAEMDALLACARNGVSPRDCTLYSTTFPCHNCTRHIIAAGLKRVVYIEPYPKSQAGPLHEDGIRVEDAPVRNAPSGVRDSRIPFEPFIGVGPRRFFDLFSMNFGTGYPIQRKTPDGQALEWKPRQDAKPRVPMAPSSYLEREKMASRRVRWILGSE